MCGVKREEGGRKPKTKTERTHTLSFARRVTYITQYHHHHPPPSLPDLPLKINQWANVVRWEMRTRPFLRSSEFLWQEGHTAHAAREEALDYARGQLDLYASVCEEMLALPVVKGVKSATERFAGADETFTIEALMQNGWALQSGTSHFLGQNFARAFDVFFQTAEGTRELVWATSWGVSTRLIGALVMTHSDDAGLVLPPAIAPVQVVVVPILKGDKATAENDAITAFVNTVVSALRTQGVRVHIDDRPNLRPVRAIGCGRRREGT